MVPLLALLSLAAPARADFAITRNEQLIRLTEEELAAGGGEADCEVQFSVDQGAGSSFTVVDCPEAYREAVEQAASVWRFRLEDEHLDLRTLILVRGPARSDPSLEPPEGAAVVEPEPKRTAHPYYPKRGKYWPSRVPGELFVHDCVVVVIVDERGRPEEIDSDACGEAFRYASEQAARRWRFHPMQVDGQPARSHYEQTLRYLLH